MCMNISPQNATDPTLITNAERSVSKIKFAADFDCSNRHSVFEASHWTKFLHQSSYNN